VLVREIGCRRGIAGGRYLELSGAAGESCRLRSRECHLWFGRLLQWCPHRLEVPRSRKGRHWQTLRKNASRTSRGQIGGS